MSRKKKNQQGKQSDLAIAKLALLAGRWKLRVQSSICSQRSSTR